MISSFERVSMSPLDFSPKGSSNDPSPRESNFDLSLFDSPREVESLHTPPSRKSSLDPSVSVRTSSRSSLDIALRKSTTDSSPPKHVAESSSPVEKRKSSLEGKTSMRHTFWESPRSTTISPRSNTESESKHSEEEEDELFKRPSPERITEHPALRYNSIVGRVEDLSYQDCGYIDGAHPVGSTDTSRSGSRQSSPRFSKLDEFQVKKASSFLLLILFYFL